MDTSSATAQVALAILSKTTVRRSALDQEDLKPYWKSEKSHIFLGGQQSYYLLVFQKMLLTTEKRLTGRLLLAAELYPTFVNTGTTDETFQQSGK